VCIHERTPAFSRLQPKDMVLSTALSQLQTHDLFAYRFSKTDGEDRVHISAK
jgi:hypothetical protein